MLRKTVCNIYKPYEMTNYLQAHLKIIWFDSLELVACVQVQFYTHYIEPFKHQAFYTNIEQHTDNILMHFCLFAVFYSVKNICSYIMIFVVVFHPSYQIKLQQLAHQPPANRTTISTSLSHIYLHFNSISLGSLWFSLLY